MRYTALIPGIYKLALILVSHIAMIRAGSVLQVKLFQLNALAVILQARQLENTPPDNLGAG